MLDFIKIRPVGTELFLARKQTDRHDEASSHFSQFCEHSLKYGMQLFASCSETYAHRL